MDLQTQIITLTFSFFYGIFFAVFIGINYKIIYHDKKYIKLIGSFLIVLLGVLLYFIILRKINYAAFHPYCLLMLTIGFCLEHFIVKRFKKWYTYFRIVVISWRKSKLQKQPKDV